MRDLPIRRKELKMWFCGFLYALNREEFILAVE